jgi:hypothetical protein
VAVRAQHVDDVRRDEYGVPPLLFAQEPLEFLAVRAFGLGACAESVQEARTASRSLLAMSRSGRLRSTLRNRPLLKSWASMKRLITDAFRASLRQA